MKPIQDPAFAEWARSQGIVAIYAHGSVVRGSARPDSDLDVAVLGGSSELLWLDGLARRLEPLLDSSRELDLRPLAEAPPAFQLRVIADRCLLFEGDRTARIAFERELLNERMDYRYYEDLLAEAMRSRIAEGRYGRQPAFRRAPAE